MTTKRAEVAVGWATAKAATGTENVDLSCQLLRDVQQSLWLPATMNRDGGWRRSRAKGERINMLVV